MTTHTAHVDPTFDQSAPVLTDGCPRCLEHSADPASSLSPDFVQMLRERALRPGASTLDWRAFCALRLAEIKRGAK